MMFRLLLGFLFFPFFLQAQEEFSNSLPVPKYQIRFSLSSALFDNLKLDNTGKEILQTRFTPGGNIGIGFYQSFYKTWGFNIGGELVVQPYNIRFYNKNAKFLEFNEYDYNHWTYNLSGSLEKHFVSSKGRITTIEAGIKLNRLVAWPYEIDLGTGLPSYSNPYSYGKFDFHLENYYQRIFSSYFLKAGTIKVYNSKNTLHLKVVGNYSPASIGRGWYRFRDIGVESHGTATLNMNYLGVEFTYGLKPGNIFKNYETQPVQRKTTFLLVSGGFGYAPTKINDPNNLIVVWTPRDPVPHIAIEQNLSRTIYAETGLSWNRYLEGFSVAGYTAFDAGVINLGVGKRFSTRNNYNYLNLSIGTTLGITDASPNGGRNSGELTRNEQGDTLMIIYSKGDDFTLKRYFSLIYIGVSKDFKLYRNLYLNFLYRFYQGIIPVYERKVSYESVWSEGLTSARVYQNGSLRTFQVGIKYRLERQK